MSRLDVDRVNGRLRRRSVSWDLHFEPVCGSTQDLAREALKAGAASGFVVSTDFQSAGRGRQGRSWSAPPGRAVLFSAILSPPADAIRLAPLLAGLAIADGIHEASGLAPELKWPNDLLSGGRKLAGILSEQPAGGLTIIGAGINVNQSEDELPPGGVATSLALEVGHQLAREPLLAGVLNGIDAAWARVTAQGPDWIVPAWRRRTSMLGREISFTLEGVARAGVAEDIDTSGALLVRLAGGRRIALVAGDVQEVRS